MRWQPKWRESGQEPDYRFTLANERTFLAWIGSALALLVQFATRLSPPWLVASTGLMVAGFAGVRRVLFEASMPVGAPAVALLGVAVMTAFCSVGALLAIAAAIGRG